jgi:hypothetical protein
MARVSDHDPATAAHPRPNRTLPPAPPPFPTPPSMPLAGARATLLRAATAAPPARAPREFNRLRDQSKCVAWRHLSTAAATALPSFVPTEQFTQPGARGERPR